LIDHSYREATVAKQTKIAELRELLEHTHTAEGSLAKWLRRPEITWTSFASDLRDQFPGSIWEQVETDLKYDGYIKRQTELVDRTRRLEDKLFPADTDFASIYGLKREAQLKLAQIRPQTLGQAGRISGITPADISLLAIWLRSHSSSPPAP
jgi:tRNA uridine 5-carboxymethylaminomethyl modification enzyme